MEKEIVVTKRFRAQTKHNYEYLLRDFSARVAFQFLEKVEERIELIARHPEIGRPSMQGHNVRFIPLIPYYHVFYRVRKSRIEILVIFDLRQDPKRRPYH
ncbi:MAG: type II toxin-antitoxin system RelE/ParE family toxin [Flammeovirgaceae bacterium]